MLVLNLPFKALMFLTLMRPSLVLFLVLWLKLVKDFLKVRCRLALLPFLISCLIWLDLVASLPLIKERIRSEERFSRNAETDIVCRLLLEKKKEHRTDGQHEEFGDCRSHSTCRVRNRSVQRALSHDRRPHQAGGCGEGHRSVLDVPQQRVRDRTGNLDVDACSCRHRRDSDAAVPENVRHDAERPNSQNTPHRRRRRPRQCRSGLHIRLW